MRKLILVATVFVQVLYLFLFCCKDGCAALGDTSVCKWKGNKTGAFTIMFDDSMLSQADVAIPHMISRGLTGSFYCWILGDYQDRKSYWEGTAIANGMELANHTMNHITMTAENVEYEMGGCAEYLWSVLPSSESKLNTFSVPWSWGSHPGVTSEMKDYLSAKYFIPRSNFDNDNRCLPIYYNGATPSTNEQLIAYAQEAVNTGGWTGVYFHGIGSEWTPTPTARFDALLDYLASVKETTLWVGTAKKVYMYQEERKTAGVVVKGATANTITLGLTSDQHPSNMTGNLYNEPLTLRTEVPSNWASCRVTQGADSKVYFLSSTILQYDALPNSSDIVLVVESTGTADTTPPSTPAAVRDGTSVTADYGSTDSTSKLTANWDAATDAQSGISGYRYAIGTTQGGTQTAAWTALGNVLTVTRAGLTLTVGTTYYFSVTALNGYGVESSAANSNGQACAGGGLPFSDDFEWTTSELIWDSQAAAVNYILETSTTVAKAGSKSLHIRDASASSSGECVYLTKVFSPGISTDMYIRFFYYIPTGMRATLGSHIFAYVTGSNGARIWIGWNNSPFMHNNSDVPNFDEAPDSEGVWHNYQVHLGAPSAASIGEMWRDEVKCTETMSTNLSGHTYNSMRFGYAYNLWDQTNTGDFYLDELVVDDTYVGTTPGDTTPPGAPAAVRDGTGTTDASTTSSMMQLSANWDAAVDNESTVTHYWYAIGTSAGATDITNALIDNGAATSVTKTGLTLTAGTMYYFTVKAQSTGGTGIAANSNGILVQSGGGGDTTAPGAPAAVRDGTSATADSGSTNSTTQLSANWDAATDNESAISRYDYSIGTTPGSTNVLGWTSNGTNLSVTKTGLTLTAGTTYYFNVKAVSAGGTGSAANSNGQTVTTVPDTTVPAAPSTTYPNPYSLSSVRPLAFIVSGGAGGEVSIYSITGRLIKKLTAASGNQITWDGRNEDGEKVARGIYIYRITESSGNNITGKLAIIR